MRFKQFKKEKKKPSWRPTIFPILFPKVCGSCKDKIWLEFIYTKPAGVHLQGAAPIWWKCLLCAKKENISGETI